jgi:hypothetical protein
VSDGKISIHPASYSTVETFVFNPVEHRDIAIAGHALLLGTTLDSQDYDEAEQG